MVNKSSKSNLCYIDSKPIEISVLYMQQYLQRQVKRLYICENTSDMLIGISLFSYAGEGD